MPRYLLDASAVLAFLGREEGAGKVFRMIEEGDARITVVNMAEVATKLVDRGMPIADAEYQCRSLGVEIIGMDADIAFAAAALVRQTRPLGLSLGDRICLATAARDSLMAVTADRVWAQVPGVSVEVIR